MSDHSPAELSTIASQLRTLYLRRKRVECPNYKLNPRDRKNTTWNKAAAACTEAGADPRDWIEAAFMYCTLGLGPVPHTLAGNAMSKWYKEYCKKTESGLPVGSIEAKVRFDFSILFQAIKRNNNLPLEEQLTLEEVILDPLNYIPPYVAVVAAPTSEVILNTHLDAARKSVRGSVAYLDAIHACGMDPKILVYGNEPN